MRPRLIPLVAVAAALSACLPGAVRRPSTPAPAVPSDLRAPNVAGPWVTARSSASQQLSISTTAVVLIGGDGGTRADTLRAVLSASYVGAPGGPGRVDGILKDYRVQSGSGAEVAPAGLQLPRPFSVDFPSLGKPGAFRLPAEASACVDPALSVLQGLHDAWVRLPDTLSVNREWTDTVHTLSCRDRILLRGTLVRRFRVLRAELEGGAHVVVLIDRTSKGRLDGEGEPFGERTTVAGESVGTLRYVVDPVLGRPLRASGSGTLTFVLKSSRRNQNVKQESVLALTWVP